MQAPQEILSVWSRFDSFPMETLTKAWRLKKYGRPAHQRSVVEMREHRALTGASGNCFDLAIWLLEELRAEGIEAYGIGEGNLTVDAHVAIVAVSPRDGSRYLCDLGDMWIQPVRIESTSAPLSGFFPAASISLDVLRENLTISYHRPNGKMSSQDYLLDPISDADLVRGGEILQNHLSAPLVEKRMRHGSEIAHWEFDQFQSFMSTNAGLLNEPECDSIEMWAARISDRTGMERTYVAECLKAFGELTR